MKMDELCYSTTLDGSITESSNWMICGFSSAPRLRLHAVRSPDDIKQDDFFLNAFVSVTMVKEVLPEKSGPPSKRLASCAQQEDNKLSRNNTANIISRQNNLKTLSRSSNP